MKLDYNLVLIFCRMVAGRMATGDSLAEARAYAMDVLKAAVAA